MQMLSVLAVLVLVTEVVSDIPHYTKKQINDLIDKTKINYGSTIRVKANAFAY